MPQFARSGFARRSVLGGGLALVGAGLAGCHRAGRGPLRVAITGKGENDTELLFRHAGIKPDYPISYTRFQSGHLVVEAMNSGALDLGGMSEIPPCSPRPPAQSFRQIAVYHGDVNNQVILVPKDPRSASWPI
jgi:sulfonate transport system substrate-binding protein